MHIHAVPCQVLQRVLKGGRLIPGHEPRIWSEPEKLGFRKVSEHAVAIVE